MSAITLTRLYEVLVPKLGKEATESLITYNESTMKSEMENNCKHLATKGDISVMKETISSIKETNISIMEKLDRIDEKIEAKVGKSHTELIRWMFAFWASQITVIVGYILLFLRK